MDFALIVVAAIGVVGIIEYVKGVWKKAPSWVWQIVSPLACAVVAFVQGGGWQKEVLTGLVLLALCELAYQKIVAAIGAIVDSATKK